MRVTEQAAFAPRDSARGVVFRDKMWLANGYPGLRDLWYSSDGRSWSKALDQTPFSVHARLVVFESHLWAIGKTIWRSRDGVNWLEIARDTPYANIGQVVVHDGRLWMLGNGEEVWSSPDGIYWTCVTRRAPYGKRNAPAVAVFGDRLWLIGGSTPAPGRGFADATRRGYPNLQMRNDVWSSADGVHWTVVLDHAPWTPRMWFSAQEYANALWISGGYDNDRYINLADTWYSKDGVSWQRLESGGWTPRHQATTYVHGGSLFMVAGNTWPVVNDVWKLTVRPFARLPRLRRASTAHREARGKRAQRVICSKEGWRPLAESESPPFLHPTAEDECVVQVVDIAEIHRQGRGFFGGVFDGRHIYLVPNHNGTDFSGHVARYDTARQISESSWSFFDATEVNRAARGFAGGVFDGRFVYLIPDSKNDTAGLVTRYDTDRPFSSPDAWEVFDLTTLEQGAKGYRSAVFDGRYVYLVPYHRSGEGHGSVARYDTTAALSSREAWSFFDASTLDARAKGFIGAAFDGRYIYLVPTHDGISYHGLALQYDTRQPFGLSDSWGVFDVSDLRDDARGFVGAAFDGRFIYYVPFTDGRSGSGVVARYDTHQTFSSAKAWRTFDMKALNSEAAGFAGGTFDGRYVYFVPLGYGSPLGQVTRYDTTRAFTSPSAWEILDLSRVDAAARGFNGAVYDGQYVYLVPGNNGSAHGSVVRIVAPGGADAGQAAEAVSGDSPSPSAEPSGHEAGGQASDRFPVWGDSTIKVRVLEEDAVRSGSTLSEVLELEEGVDQQATYAFEFTGFVEASVAGGYQVAVDCTCAADWARYDITAVDHGTGKTINASRHQLLGGNDGSHGSARVLVRISGTIAVKSAGVLRLLFAQENDHEASSLLRGSRFQTTRIH